MGLQIGAPSLPQMEFEITLQAFATRRPALPLPNRNSVRSLPD
jgi:hypothetical protein